MPPTDKLPPGPHYEPVTSWTEITLWLLGIVVVVTVAVLVLVLVS